MKVWSWVVNIFNKLVAIASEIIKEVFDVAFKIAMAKLKDIAANTVKELSTSDMSSSAKREEAFKRIQEYAVSHAISVSNSDINLIIEIFVRQLKKITGEIPE